MAVQTTGRERKKKPREDLCTDKSGQQREKKSANQSVKILCFPNSADFYFIFKYITEETACRRDLITFLSTSANSRLQLFQPKTKPPQKTFHVSRNAHRKPSIDAFSSLRSVEPLFELGYTVYASDGSNCRNYVTYYKTIAHNVPSSLLKTTSTTVISPKALLWPLCASSTLSRGIFFFLPPHKYGFFFLKKIIHSTRKRKNDDKSNLTSFAGILVVDRL